MSEQRTVAFPPALLQKAVTEHFVASSVAPFSPPWPELVLCSIVSIHLETETSALDKSSAHTECL